MLGIRQIVVLVNKMDLVGYKQEVFDSIVSEYTRFLSGIDVTAKAFIPVSGMEGDAIAALTDKMPWYSGQTTLEALDNFQKEPPPVGKPFRMPVQDVYKFTKAGDQRRIIAASFIPPENAAKSKHWSGLTPSRQQNLMPAKPPV
jgi:bifunctional enzyme CysN/CysC